ncbi:MAG: acetyltransferase [Rikenellaceae bacterium]|nr:acetyltransferase [Rikenellaceae bacterium]
MKLRNHYSFTAKARLAYWLLRTRLLWPQARLIRFPFDLRGKRFVDPGTGLTTGVGCRIEAFSDRPCKKIVFGNHVQLNDYVHISALESVRIGDHVLIASHVYISDNSHGRYAGTSHDAHPDTPPIERPHTVAPVSIGSNTWIGEGVIVLPGVSIGRGCVIGAHAVVNRDIPDHSIAAGSPASVIKRYNTGTGRWERVPAENTERP